ncbi:MAG: ATP synthase F1 subunit gamma [Clostridiales bacterium]|nr:ATP synthase F1 subunit gamma [Candidatus Crickella merdequi]
MASMRDIKRRKSSIQSTGQITKAMKLVSTVKLQRSKQAAENSKDYFNYMYQTVQSMLAKAGSIDHPYVNGNDCKKKAVVMITGNRGLAGGYNSNVVKLITRGNLPKEDLVIYSLGKKGRESMARYGYELANDYSEMIDDPQYIDAMRLSNELLKAYKNGEIGEIYLAYTYFKNTVVHEPKLMKLLPVEQTEDMAAEVEAPKGEAPMNFEPEEEEALDLIIPKYVTSLIYGGMIESVASENGARMQAMDNATTNAEEMIDKLTLQYNRARQGSITQELTEIIAGSQAQN